MILALVPLALAAGQPGSEIQAPMAMPPTEKPKHVKTLSRE